MSQLFAHVRSMIVVLACLSAYVVGQSQNSVSPSATAVPAMVKFSGTVQGSPSRIIGITFALYKDQQGGAALWLETQSVSLDAAGHYTVTLGATLPNGVPTEVFASGEARWLGIQPEGQAEQPRVLLLSVPYALKAADAQTLGGLPASAFVLATPSSSSPVATPRASSATAATATPLVNPAVTGVGTLNFVPLWDSTSDIVSSVVSQTGTGATAKIGINTTSPATTLDVKGGGTFRGALALAATGTATAAGGKTSQSLNAVASAFNSSTNAAVNETFRWQAEAAGNNTANPSATLNFLFGAGKNTPTETGLSIGSNGQITFATGQAFPGAGTITGVTAGTGLTGGGSTGSVTLNLDTTMIPELNVSNTFVGSQAVSGNLSATGTVAGSSFQIGSDLFGFGSIANQNAFLGFSGNTTLTGIQNTANGVSALASVTTGWNNTAAGNSALQLDTTGSGNTASGFMALFQNTTGTGNSAEGAGALSSNTTGSTNTANGGNALMTNTTGSNNTASGAFAGLAADSSSITGSNNLFLGANTAVSTGTLTNATAVGANAQVNVSNAMVLGGIKGVNGATSNTSVGIGTTTPAFTLDVHGTGNFTGPITFAAGQTFPGAGTITGVTAGSGLTGGGSSGGVTLNVDATKVVTGVTAGTGLTGGGTGGVQTLSVDTTKIPQLAAANTFTGNQNLSANLSVTGNMYVLGNTTLTGDLNSSGNLNASQTVSGAFVNALSFFSLNGSPFAFGSSNSENAFLGFAGNISTTGVNNTASGYQALVSNMTGSYNTASGVSALINNNGGSYNTAIGYLAGSDKATPGLTNATAIGSFADVSASNALVLGSINGVNSATASTNVGIGTTTPTSTLDVEATAPGLVGPIFLLKNNASVQSGIFGNSVDFRFALDGGSSVGNPNAYIRAAEDGSSQYGSWISFATMADGGAGSGPLERMRIASNGFVGIGVSPIHIFQVGQGMGAAFADSWSTYSSRRWKTNIQTLPDALAKVERLRGVSYDLKGSGKHEIGVIAEEVGNVVPEVVSFEENGKDAQGVDYSRLTALLIEAMKQQQRQIQEQKRLIRTQQRQISQLAGKVGVLETTLRTTKRPKSGTVRAVRDGQTDFSRGK